MHTDGAVVIYIMGLLLLIKIYFVWDMDKSVNPNIPPQTKVMLFYDFTATQRAHDAIATSLWRQNDFATSFLRHNDVIIALCARWGYTVHVITSSGL